MLEESLSGADSFCDVQSGSSKAISGGPEKIELTFGSSLVTGLASGVVMAAELTSDLGLASGLLTHYDRNHTLKMQLEQFIIVIILG